MKSGILDQRRPAEQIIQIFEISVWNQEDDYGEAHGDLGPVFKETRLTSLRSISARLPAEGLSVKSLRSKKW